ncbi:aldehyde dehydrogenase family protein [Streptomyces subrutilus]|uniref:aldehyde dehydrogenase family protein n=1 Tax=Streptomyces subrutilus TaxID=36818 RepID=UPI0033EF4545
MSDQRKSPFATVNPYTGETLADFDAIEGDAVDDAVETAGRAFEGRRARPIAERAARILPPDARLRGIAG